MTNQDQEKAIEIADRLAKSYDFNYPLAIDLITAALAEEREKARAPFLALADEALRVADEQEASHPSSPRVRAVADTRRIYAYALRRAAEEG